MGKVKPAQHHWWPEGLSNFWKNAEGGVHWLLPSGEVKPSVPKNFGKIGNGHNIQLGKSGEETVWDQSLEAEFQKADDYFPFVIQWLQALKEACTAVPSADRFHPVSVTDEELQRLTECLISLAVRSPMNRESAVGAAEYFRGPLKERERNMLIALNMRNSQRDAVKRIGIRGKFVAIYSPEREFIFGDGFYHNIRSPLGSIWSLRMFVPLTPEIAVLFAQPSSYTVHPRFFTLSINAQEAREFNETTQVYARKQIFYRSQKPEIIEAYKQEQHLHYTGVTDPITEWIHRIPGVTPRDTSLDFLFARRKED